MKDPAKIISEFIEKFGLTVTEFADLCGVCHGTIYNILNHTYIPTLTTCLKIDKGTNGFIKYGKEIEDS
jgi:DNA-binding XRE family transcriptional regulator